MLFQKEAYQLPIEISIRLVTHRQIQPGLFIYDALIMRKGIKSILSVIGAHSTFAKTSKAHFACGKVNDGIIDASASESAPGDYFTGKCFITGEDIKGKRMGEGIDVANDLI